MRQLQGHAVMPALLLSTMCCALYTVLVLYRAVLCCARYTVLCGAVL